MMFTPGANSDENDAVSETLSKIARMILIGTLGLTPIFFIPVAYAPFNFSKVLFVIVGVLLSLIFYSLASLREGKLSFYVSPHIYVGWFLSVAVVIAALFSGDVRDSLLGDDLGVHTAVFVALLALVISAMPILRKQKSTIMHLYIAITAAGLLIGLYHILRFMFGADTLTFGVFTSATATPLGGWNDLAIFFGLSLILALIAVEQFPLTKMGRSIFAGVAVIALIMLAVVNFFAIWVVLGLVSLVVLMYTLTKNRFKSNTPSLSKDLSNDSAGTVASTVLSVAVFIVSVIFLIGGSGLGQMISNATGVSYVEVRPSFGATLDIARNVYGENAFTGIGPNRFADAWRLYKDPAINQTIFWNTPFNAGSGYIPTFVVTSGILGALAWLVFIGVVLFVGIRVLFTTQPVDRYWYFIGSSSFASVLFLWGMSFLYVPGPAILILTALFTGILFTTYIAVVPQKQITLSIAENRRSGFALVAMSMIVIVGSVAVIYYSGRQYSGLLSFNQAFASVRAGTPIATLEQQIASSYRLSANDKFAREIAGLQITKMNTLLAVPEPNEAQQQQFYAAAENAVSAARLAVQLDPTDSRNQLVLGSVFSILAGAGVEGAYDSATESFAKATALNPSNPEIKLLAAQLESRTGNLDAAREKVLEAVTLKSNYTDALYFLTQLEIARGDVESAIRTTQATITLDPRNPSRYYQLGVLLASNNNIEAATTAFETAVRFDPNYANARYFLALAYSELGRPEEARAQLEVVLSLNPDATQVSDLIDRLGQGESFQLSSGTPEPVPESADVSVSEDGEVSTTEDPDTPLLSPVNTVPGSGAEPAEVPAEETPTAEGEETASETEETPAE